MENENIFEEIGDYIAQQVNIIHSAVRNKEVDEHSLKSVVEKLVSLSKQVENMMYILSVNKKMTIESLVSLCS